MVEKSEELRDERQRGAKDGGRYLGDAGEGFPLARGTEELAGVLGGNIRPHAVLEA